MADVVGLKEGVVNVLVINDNPDHIATWRRIFEDENWHSVGVEARTAEEASRQIDALLNGTIGDFDATFVDVILRERETYGGIDVIVKAAAKYDRQRFGEIVVASSHDYGDKRVAEFVKSFRAIRGPSPVGGVQSMLKELKKRLRRRGRLGGESADAPRKPR